MAGRILGYSALLVVAAGLLLLPDQDVQLLTPGQVLVGLLSKLQLLFLVLSSFDRNSTTVTGDIKYTDIKYKQKNFALVAAN